MSIKTKRIICAVLMLLPTLYTAALMPFLPDTIPAHYGIDNAVDRYGSKLECFILPLCIIAIGAFMILTAWLFEKSSDEQNHNESITLIINICVLLMFNAIQAVLLYLAANSIESLDSAKLDLSSVIGCLFGVYLIVIGNFMPKVRYNSILGLRTSSSMKNEQTWRLSQRFGGYAAIVGGFILMAGSFILHGDSILILLITVVMAMVFVDSIYAYLVSLKN